MNTSEPIADSDIVESLNGLAKEVGATFKGFEGKTLVFEAKQPEREAGSLSDIMETLVKLLMTSQELKKILRDYPAIILR